MERLEATGKDTRHTLAGKSETVFPEIQYSNISRSSFLLSAFIPIFLSR